MEYKIRKSYGAWYGLIIGAAVFGFCLWGIGFSLGEEDKILKLMLLVPAYIFMCVYAGYVFSAFTIRYIIGEKGITIKAGIRKVYIDYNDINEIINVKGKSNIFSIIGANWAGLKLGLFTVRGIGPIRFYATKPAEGFIYIKSGPSFIGITPADDVYNEVLQKLQEKSRKEIEIFNVEEMTEEERGENTLEDRFYKLLLRINVIFLFAFGLYLAVFFPGSGATNFIILLMVLALALFFFTISNAERLYQFSSMGGYILLTIGILVTGIFFILSFAEIHL